MKCIDDELIQRYIDGEIDARETDRIEKHLADCSPCARNVAEQRVFADGIKRTIGQWSAQPVIIPEFVAPVARKRRLNVKIRHYVYAVSAACAALLFVFLLPERKSDLHNAEIHLIYGFHGDFDANRPISQQEMTIMMVDANGRIVEYN